MRVEQAAIIKRPVIVNDRFIERITGIVADMKSDIKKQIIDKAGINERQLNDHLTDRSPYEAFMAEPSPDDMAGIEAHYARRAFFTLIDRTAAEYERLTTTSITVSFIGGYSVRVDHIDFLKKIISDERQNIDYLNIDFGLSYASTSFSLRLSNAQTVVRHTVYSEKDRVPYYSKMISDTIEMVQPDHPILYSLKFQVALSVITGAAVFFALSERLVKYQIANNAKPDGICYMDTSRFLDCAAYSLLVNQ